MARSAKVGSIGNVVPKKSSENRARGHRHVRIPPLIPCELLRRTPRSPFFSPKALAIPVSNRQPSAPESTSAALRWRDVDLVAGRLAVTANSVRLSKRSRVLLGLTTAEPVRGDPKTARSRRVIEMPALAVEALHLHRARSNVVALNGLVFTRPDGRSLAVPTVYSRWHRLLERADVPMVRPHDARHTCATLMLGQGVHPKLVSEMLGHATVAITLDTYSHATPSMHREAATTLDALLRKVPAR
jgi:integrase